MIKAVIFDLDNTLYDYEHCNNLAEIKLYEQIRTDLGVSNEESIRLLQNAKKYVKKQLGDDVAASHNRLLYMQNICEQLGKNPLQYAMKLYNVYWNTILENMQLFNYVMPLIQILKSREIKLGMLTDLTAHIQYRKMDILNLSDKFDYFVTSEEAGAEKPSSKMFNLILGKMGVEPEDALMIGDSYTKDIVGAMNLGMNAILYNRNTMFLEKVIALLH